MTARAVGLCIGGPLDGRVAESPYDKLKVHLPLETSFSPIAVEAIPSDAVVSTVLFQHVAFHFRHSDRPGWEEQRGFWVPDDVRDPRVYVLDQLSQAYRGSRNITETDRLEKAYDHGRRDMLNALLALNPAAAAALARLHGRVPDPVGRLPFDVFVWVTEVALQLGIKPLDQATQHSSDPSPIEPHGGTR